MNQEHRFENVVIFRDPCSEFGTFLLLILLAIAAIYLTALFDWSVQRAPLGTILGKEVTLPIPFFALLPMIVGTVIAHRLLNYRYILCENYLLKIKGLLALSRHSQRLNYVHVSGIEIHQSLLQLILGLGDLQIIGTIAAVGNPPFTITGVRNPRRIKDLIQERVDAHVSNVSVLSS